MKTKVILIIACISLFQKSVLAQNDDISIFNNLYMGVEIGKSSGYQNFAQGGMWLQLDHNYFKIKGTIAFDNATEEQKQFYKHHAKNCDCIQSRDLADVSLIYGRSHNFFKRHQIQFGTGISMVSKTDKDDKFNYTKQLFEPERYKERYTVGLPIEIRYALYFKRYFSVNCSLHMNVNPIKSFSGLSAGVTMGMF